MSGYTPTTDEVRELIDPLYEGAFNRWLAQVKRDAAAEVRAEVRRVLEMYRDDYRLNGPWLAVTLTPLTEEA